MARASGARVQDVKHWQSLGLLQSPRRRRSQTEDIAFHQEHVDRLRFIRQALDVGFSYENIALLVGSDGLPTCGEVLRTAKCRVEELRRLWGQSAPPAAALESLANTCAGTCSRNDCTVLTVLNRSNAARGPSALNDMVKIATEN
ncbi:MAG: MerR family DNA-binding protein [Proteobacteria bacterium]|nr:MerR family DNA-binding protein [Pseudomonadota bacterium]